jgi:hypothetical protein
VRSRTRGRWEFSDLKIYASSVVDAIPTPEDALLAIVSADYDDCSFEVDARAHELPNAI